jgi:lipoprotein NlpD
MYRDGALLLFAICMAGCRTPPQALPEPPQPPGHTVEVQPGETLWEIARDNGLSVEELVEVNGLENANELAAGQMIFVPAGGLAPTTKTAATKTPPPLRPVIPAKPTTPPTASGLIWPVDGVVLRDFQPASGKREGYEGLLIASPAGTPVRCAKDGVVAFAGSQGTSLGTFVIVEHDRGLVTIYGHLGAASVQAGARVTQGAPLGVVGTTGLLGSSPRVQFQVRRQQTPLDPLTMLPN